MTEAELEKQVGEISQLLDRPDAGFALFVWQTENGRTVPMTLCCGRNTSPKKLLSIISHIIDDFHLAPAQVVGSLSELYGILAESPKAQSSQN